MASDIAWHKYPIHPEVHRTKFLLLVVKAGTEWIQSSRLRDTGGAQVTDEQPKGGCSETQRVLAQGRAGEPAAGKGRDVRRHTEMRCSLVKCGVNPQLSTRESRALVSPCCRGPSSSQNPDPSPAAKLPRLPGQAPRSQLSAPVLVMPLPAQPSHSPHLT